jgi:hypothetical protein
MSRKPIKSGLDYVRGDGWVVRLFTRKSAQRFADAQARKSRMRGAMGLVSDLGDYFRVNVAAQPFD